MKLLLATFIAASVFLLGAALAVLQTTEAFAPAPEGAPVVFVEKTEGGVRVKPPQSAVWSGLNEGSYLRPGTLLYVNAGSFVDLNYFRERARLRYASEGLFAIGSTTPSTPKFRKEFLALATQNPSALPASLGQALGADFSTVLNHPSAKDRRIRSAKLTQTDGSIAIFKETDVLKYRNRGTTVRYYTRSETALVDIGFMERRKRENIYGYLWLNDQRKPIWSGVTRAGFAGLRLRPGAYTFQALTESESAVSDPLKVIVEQHQGTQGVAAADLWPDETWENREARIFQ